EIEYTEVSFSTDIANLRDTDDGDLDNAHTLRDTYGADLVALIVDGEGACGVGYIMTSLSVDFASSAFSVIDQSCATGMYTFAHELGHNMGCHHAVGDNSLTRGAGLFDYSHGWRFNSDSDRTIMAYSPGTRRQYFSNPEVSFGNSPTGIAVGEANQAHNALSINNAAETIANFRQTSLSTEIVKSKPFLLAADLNRDGQDDLVYISQQGYLFYTVNRSSWTRIGINRFRQVVAGDFDNDNADNDLAAINLNRNVIYSTDLTSWQKSGENKFTTLRSFDRNEDGYREALAGINLNSYVVYTAAVSSASWVKSGLNKFSSLASFDFDADGNAETLAGVNLNSYLVYTSSVENATWQKSGENKFSALLPGDFNNNGINNNLAGVNLNQYVVYSTDLTGWSKSGSNRLSSAVSVDFDGDGDREGFAGLSLNQYAVYTTTAANASWTRIGSNKGQRILSGDFDGDGKQDDLAIVNLNNDVLYTLNNDSPVDPFSRGWVKISKPQ
ncbi:MAG: hypothetical protein GY868_04410, partial [Deltaproteobacteria bacterium]|nr:hypothetical protein [Deltaproteobacteria bacterium]